VPGEPSNSSWDGLRAFAPTRWNSRSSFSSVGSSTLPELARVGSNAEDTSASIAGTSGQVSSTQASALNGEVAEPPGERTFSVPAQKRRRVIVASLALTSACALGGWFLLSPAEVGKPAAAAAPVQIPVPDLLHIVVRASPGEAVLFLDEKRLPRNPMTLEVPRDGSKHRLRAEAGASTLARVLTYDRDQSLGLELAAHATAARAPAVVNRTPPVVAAPSTTPAKEASNAPRTQDDARPAARPARAHRALDEQNPY